MSVNRGTRVGPYEVLSSLGAGGMGEVYRARDTRLGREVALKVIPAVFSADPDRLARFEREAQLLAALNHPHIAQVYGLEEDAHGTALIMELVEGLTLADRIEQGPIPIEEALAVARQIAEALEAAHEQGIVHRDLKPANVKLRPDGAVKVLDFGLAKLMNADPAASSGRLSISPTISPATTEAGVILGTAAYMSPEQARGKAIDKRADIWAFGVVVFEMITGRRLFEAETMSDTIAAVLTRDPDLAELPPGVPAHVRTLLQRCLDRDPLRRLRDIGEARVVLSAPALVESLPPSRRSGVGRMPRAGRAILLLTAGLVAAGLTVGYIVGRRPSLLPDTRPLVYEIPVPAKAELNLASKPSVAIAPDGSAIVFVASSDGVSRLYFRTRADVTARMLPGTEDAAEPVFSPDGKWIAFTAARDLKKVPLDGPPVTLAKGLVLEDSRGITWTDRNEIVFAPDPRGSLVKVDAEGGAVTSLTTLDVSAGERTHRWPVALPAGRIVLFTVGSRASPDDYESARIDAVDLDTSKRWTVASNASMATYLASGHLLLARGGTLSGAPLDVETAMVTGPPTALVQGVAGDVTSGAVHASVARDGTLVYVTGSGGSNLRRLVWADRSGTITPVDLPPAVYGDPKISPDGTRAAILVGANGSGDVHLYDFADGTFTPFTFDGRNASPAWSPDGRDLFYVGMDPQGTKSQVFRRPADGSRNAEEVASMDSTFYLMQVVDSPEAVIGDYFTRLASADGVPAVPDGSRSLRGFDAILQQTKPGSPPVVLASGPSDDYRLTRSPDGKWLLYTSQRSGRPEVYVRDVREGGGVWQVSTAGGEEPHWTPDGREILYRYGTRLFAAAVELSPTFRAARPRVILEGIYDLRSETLGSFDIDRRTGRLLMVRLDQATGAPPAIRVVVNWFNDVRRLTAR